MKKRMSQKLLKTSAFLALLVASGLTGSAQQLAQTGGRPLTHVVIDSKPDPKGLAGLAIESECTIVIRAELSADGKVRNVSFVKVKPKNVAKETVKILRERAIAAAKEIEFTPATNRGRPVSTIMLLEYSFGPPKLDRPSIPPALKPTEQKPRV